MLATRIIKPILSYGFGNIINTIAMILLLPTLVHLDSENGFFAAQGMLIAQVVSVFGIYAFSLTVPRTIKNLREKIIQILLFELLIVQLILGVVGIGIIYFVQNHLVMSSIYGFCIVYSAVIQWQWFHITSEKFLIQISLIISTRVILLILEIFILISDKVDISISNLILPIITILFCAPIIPTFLNLNFVKIKNNYLERNIGLTIYSEIINGKHLFFSSLLSSLYSLGPSLVVAQINPSLLVQIQQFDRIRLAFSNFSGIFLGAIYPFLIGISGDKLMIGFKNLQKYIFIPILFLNFLTLTVVVLITFEELEFFNKLQITNTSFGLAIIAGMFAASSNIITLTFIHPDKNDKYYLKIISIGALIFIIGALISYIIFPLNMIGNFLMINVVIAESLINILLWLKAKEILSKYSSKAN